MSMLYQSYQSDLHDHLNTLVHFKHSLEEKRQSSHSLTNST